MIGKKGLQKEEWSSKDLAPAKFSLLRHYIKIGHNRKE